MFRVEQLISLQAKLSLLDIPQEPQIHHNQNGLIGSALSYLFLAKLAFGSDI